MLQYIANESQGFHTFVANRVLEIHDASKPSQWRHVAERLDPADDCTSGLRVTDLNHHCRWLAGPAFLSQSEDRWPVEPLHEDDAEATTNKWSGRISSSETRAYFSDPEKFSYWTRLERNCKLKAEDCLLTSLTASEIRNAEMVAIRRSHIELFPIDIDASKANKLLPVKGRLLTTSLS